jgi:hypothetical protein
MRMYQDVVDPFGIVRRMSRSRDGKQWFGSIKFFDENGKEQPMGIILPAEAVRVVTEKAA